MNDFCDLLGTPDAPVSKIVSDKGEIPPGVKELYFELPSMGNFPIISTENYLH